MDFSIKFNDVNLTHYNTFAMKWVYYHARIIVTGKYYKADCKC